MAGWVTHGLWWDPQTRVLAGNPNDHMLFEWLLGYGVHLFGGEADPFLTDLLNAPLGVNLAANTSITVYALLFAPLTALAGPQVSVLVILASNLAASAVAWYLFLARHLVRHRGAAALGGLFCGFAPGFVSHAGGHLNWTAGWVAPLLLWRVLALREPGRRVRNGLILGVLVAISFSIAAEGLFLVALACAVFLLAWSLPRVSRAEARQRLPTMLAGLAVTAVAAGALLAYPLYLHFAGPQSFSGTGFDQRRYSEDLLAYFVYPDRSLAGALGLSTGMAPNPTEQTSFFGPPLVVFVLVALVALLRRATPGRRATLWALTAVGVVFVVLSLGPRLKLHRVVTDVPLPYAVLAHLPLFDSALPARLALVVVGVVGIVLALSADQLLRGPRLSARARTAWVAGFVVALLPLTPTPLRWRERAPEPAFIADGTWQRYVSPGRSLTALPLATDAAPDAQRWQAYTLARGGRQFAIPGGYFLGPGGPGGAGRLGPPPRFADRLFEDAARHGHRPRITAADRELTRRDLAYWRVDAVFLADRVTGSQQPLHRAALQAVATDLLGPPHRVGDVLLWPVVPGEAVPGGAGDAPVRR